MPEPCCSSSRVDDVLTLTFNRPERRNALSDELWSALRDAVRDVADDRTCGPWC